MLYGYLACSLRSKSNSGSNDPRSEDRITNTVIVGLFLTNYPAGTRRLYNIALMSMQRHDFASTFMRRCINVMYPLGMTLHGR